MSQVSFSGKQPSYTAYVKTFPISAVDLSNTTWTNKTVNDVLVLTPTNTNASVYIKNDLIVGGSINNPSDFKLKEKIEDLSLSISDNLLKITPKKYVYIADETKKVHYGIIAQDLEEYFPNLVTTTSIPNNANDNQHQEETCKVVNYMELIPLLLVKIKDLQTQINELKAQK